MKTMKLSDDELRMLDIALSDLVAEYRERLNTPVAEFEALRAKIAKVRSEKPLVNPSPDARYDEVYDAGVAWLDEL